MVTTRSAEVVALAEELDELFAALGSEVELATVAMLVTVPVPVPLLTVSVKVAEAPLTSEGIEHVTVPATLLQAKAGPVLCVIETNVVPAGTTSLTVTFAASLGPLLVTVMLYGMLLPAVAVTGPLLRMETSALVVTVVDADWLLLAGVGSALADETVAVLVTVAPAASPPPSCTRSVKTCEPPLFRIGNRQFTVPPLPTGGVKQEKAGPLEGVMETKVVPGGKVSLRTAAWAGFGPRLAIVRV